MFTFSRPVIIEVPHFASLRGKEREIVILRSDNGETWKEHTLEATEDAVQEVLQESFDQEGNLDGQFSKADEERPPIEFHEKKLKGKIIIFSHGRQIAGNRQF